MLLGNTMTQASAGEPTPPRLPFDSVHGRQFQLIKALFPAIALRRHLGETGLERYLPAITLRRHFGELVLKHHQHLFGDVGPHPSGDQFVNGRSRLYAWQCFHAFHANRRGIGLPEPSQFRFVDGE
jgi:hypothetical protein